MAEYPWSPKDFDPHCVNLFETTCKLFLPYLYVFIIQYLIG